MNIDLDSYGSFQTNLLVKIECDFYKASPSDNFSSKKFLFSDSLNTWRLQSNVLVNGVVVRQTAPETYLPLGNLLSISGTTSEIKSSPSELTISVSGIPNTGIYELVNSRLKGSRVTVFRTFKDAGNNSDLSVVDNNGTMTNIAYRFRGIISNFSLVEDYNFNNKTSTNTISLVCTSNMGVLSIKKSGRRTNPADQKLFFPGDTSMDRVPTLVGSYYNFGAPV